MLELQLRLCTLQYIIFLVMVSWLQQAMPSTLLFQFRPFWYIYPLAICICFSQIFSCQLIQYSLVSIPHIHAYNSPHFICGTSVIICPTEVGHLRYFSLYFLLSFCTTYATYQPWPHLSLLHCTHLEGAHLQGGFAWLPIMCICSLVASQGERRHGIHTHPKNQLLTIKDKKKMSFAPVS
jgi:hypothetical protein